MVLQKVIAFGKDLEDLKHPLLGPNLKGLYVLGLWQSESRFRNICYGFYFSASLFIISQFVELWIIRCNLLEALQNLAVSALSTICLMKVIFYIWKQRHWQELIRGISNEEISALKSNDPVTRKIMCDYTKYSRFLTYLYWTLVVITNITLLASPFFNCISNEYNGDYITRPQIISSWFPFDKTKMPGYAIAILVHALFDIIGGGVVAIYDANVFVIMSFFKGQMVVLRQKCKRIFDHSPFDTKSNTFLEKIKECHRLHNFLVKYVTLFNSVLSPVMFMYVLVCSMNICCSVIQLNANEVKTSQKLLVLEYTTALISQLFLYCWHSNEIAVECNKLDRGIFESDWWKTDEGTRRNLILLAGKLTRTFKLEAGPFTTLSLSTFIEIMKGSYSFYTLFTQMRENK